VGNVLQRLKILVSRRWRWITSLVLVLIIALCAASARLFVWPPTGMPARVSAIVVIGGLGDRAPYGVQLAREDRASYLVFSKGLNWIPPGICTQHVGTATVLCYQPNPDTTQGEAEGAERLAKRYGWRSIVLVTTRDQAWRAKLWFGRCFTGQIYNSTVPVSWDQIPKAVVYEWGATIKAEVFDRSC
jgi:uncharacterized SAM-binding protein YcdF (DUF218 family)